jgi:hypothetical protein
MPKPMPLVEPVTKAVLPDNMLRFLPSGGVFDYKKVSCSSRILGIKCQKQPQNSL